VRASPVRHLAARSARRHMSVAVVIAAALVTAGLASPAAIAKDNPIVPGSGPEINDHVHGAYGFYLCDKYLPVIDGSRMEDPDGIHTHDDGLIHAHPFTKKAAGENAVLGRFLDVIGASVVPGKSLSVKPINLSVKEGMNCPNAKPAGKANIRVLLWANEKTRTPVEVPFPEKLPLRNGQVIAFVAAPAGFVPPMPPSIGTLAEPGDVALALPLTAKQKAARGTQPEVVFPSGNPPKELKVTTLTAGSGQPVKTGDLVAIDVAFGGFKNKKVIESSWKYEEPTVIRVGKGRYLAGIEQAIIGMKEGQVVQAVIPSDLAFGAQDPGGGLGPNAALVVVIRLVARQAGAAKTA
jgi:peptidylprolyl isomerase